MSAVFKHPVLKHSVVFIPMRVPLSSNVVSKLYGQKVGLFEDNWCGIVVLAQRTGSLNSAVHQDFKIEEG
jgi:hypothetical protein